jgi:PAN domain
MSECESSQSCQAYSYDKWKKFCYLKSNLKPLTLDSSSIVGVRAGAGVPTVSDAPIRMEHRSARFEGSHTNAAPAQAADSCRESCEREQKCLGYTFLTISRECNLFGEITSLVRDKNFVSGFKKQNPP